VETPAEYNVRSFGATGDGRTLDTAAINRAIEAAAAAGGGTVRFPAGSYLSFTIRLKSHIELRLDAGATLLAATPADGFGEYDAAEPNEWDCYQDFGHSHWRNSLIWGEGLESIAITGPGRIHGKGLTRYGPGAKRPMTSGDFPASLGDAKTAANIEKPEDFPMDGQGNKAIALKLCRNVSLRDFSVLMGGHFALLATGLDNLAIDNVTLDTNRDGFDIDCCRNVRIANCAVNTPNDDAIVLKSSFALGYLRATENVTIVNCQVSGFDPGTLLDGTFGRTQELAPDKDRMTGRIKLGTESNGGFKNITVANCTFERSRGFAIETVDGGVIEDVTATNLVMREVTTSPIFLRIGNRARGPEGTPIGAIRRVHISNVTASGAEPRFGAILIAGLPGHPVEDVRISGVHVWHEGGGTAADAAIEPAENADRYPEPSMFGTLPAHGIYARHVRGLTLRDITVKCAQPDARTAVQLDDVAGVRLDAVDIQREAGGAFCVLRGVSDFAARDCAGATDVRRARAEREAV